MALEKRTATADDLAKDTSTPFRVALESLGAEFALYDGVLWADHFGDIAREYRSQREDVGVFDASPIVKWRVRGRDASVAVQRFHTNCVAQMEIGRVRYGALCDQEGLVIDDGMVFRLSEQEFWLMTNKNCHAPHFASATSDLDEVSIEDITRSLPHLMLQGPRSRDALAAVSDANLDALEYFWIHPKPVRVAGIPVWVSRTGVSGELGYEIFCAPEDAAVLLKGLVDHTSAVPYGAHVVETSRIECGVIVTGTDYIPHSYTPFDLGLGRLVAFDQDFIGRRALAQRGEGSRWCVATLQLPTEELPAYGTPLIRDGAPVGTLTSPTVSPIAGPIALAVIEADLASPGTPLQVGAGSDRVEATVRDTHPAYDPGKLRRRA